MKMKKWAISAAAALMLGAFGGMGAAQAAPSYMDSVAAAETRQDLAHAETMALLWMRTSAEYRALCYQGYHAAMASVDAALADPARKAKPLAIVLDCDETVVDNTPELGGAAAAGNGNYDSPWWIASIDEERAEAMPGAADFLNAVADKGVAVFYVTNRYEPTSYDATERNLKRLDFPMVDREHLLLATTTGNKQPRYDAIAEKYDIVIFMGDNAGDFPIGTYGKGMEERNAIADAHRHCWGAEYIVFPNPVYGGWVSALAKGYMKMTPEERGKVNRAYIGK